MKSWEGRDGHDGRAGSGPRAAEVLRERDAAGRRGTGLLIFRLLADAITAGVGVGPGMAEAPPPVFLAVVVPLAVAGAAASGALAALGLSRRPAAELVRYE